MTAQPTDTTDDRHTPSGREVVVVGDINVDVVVAPSGPLRQGSDVESSTVIVGGGSAANTACWLASLGRAVRFVGVVGSDPFGTHSVDLLRAAGVSSSVRISTDAVTGLCVVLVDPSGERTMLPDAGANRLLHPDDIPVADISTAAALHVSGYSLLRPEPRDAALVALAAAHAAQVPTFIDAASSGPLRDVGAEAFLAWSEGSHLLLNAEEACALVPDADDPMTAALRLSSRHASVVLKLGADGAILVEAGQVRATQDAIPVTVIDSTGAGDAFAAGYIAAFTDGADGQDRLLAGARAGAHAVARRGARPA